MKVNEWINQKFWQSIFIPLASSSEHAGRIRIQHKLCLRRAIRRRGLLNFVHKFVAKPSIFPMSASTIN
ncbi:MAG: hypothetical protein V7K88_27410 [Nostoc sp.]|uniref:hypothetical protein n=1 Tax=Nostoc sp. TaxID=1180 RepID=UPI002FF6E98B